MATIINKKVKNYRYYYYVESKRINGKPKLVNQKYLGTAEAILEKVLFSERNLQEQVLYSNETEFGTVMLVYDIAKRLGIIDIIDNIIPKRKQGATVGTYILTGVINRATDPTSKSGMPEWYADTCLPYVTGHKPKTFSPQNFWNNTCISAEDVDKIENAILEKIIDAYDIDTTHIIYDATNFFTFIDTMQDCDLAKRSKSKDKRHDLRVVGLSLMVSPDFAIPLLHETYPGNRHDAKEFPVMMKKLKARYETITKKSADVTVVFDRGNNSEENLDILESEDSKLHFIGGLKKNQAKELFAIDRSEYTPLCAPLLTGESAYRKKIEAFGRIVTAVIVHNPELEEGQMQGILIDKEKAETELLVLQKRLIRRANGEMTRGKKPTVESVTDNVLNILKADYMQDIFRYKIISIDDNIMLDYEAADEELDRIRKEELGKSVLFTNRDDFTNEQIVVAYRSSWHVESAFKQMKNTKYLSVRPMFHWTSEKIRVHIFTCVLAYRLCTLLIKELSEHGISISINRLIKEMSRIKRIHTFFGDLKKPTAVESFTLGSELASRIEQFYSLKEKYS